MSGHAWGIPYHCSKTLVSWRRKSAARSNSLTLAASNSFACAIATPWGVAKNTASHSLSLAFSGVVNFKSTRLRKDGNISATAIPASEREVIECSWTWGCWAKRRSNSTPVYPVPPTIPTLIMLFSIAAYQFIDCIKIKGRISGPLQTFRCRLTLTKLLTTASTV